jgi:thymidine kinase
MIHTTGSIQLITGSMFSGKTTRLIEQYKDLIAKGVMVLIFNHSFDKRYSNESFIVTHDKCVAPCTFIEHIKDILLHPNYSNSEYILIDEGQFFTEITKYILQIAEKDNKHIIIAGLLTDSNRNKFGELLDIVPYIDSIDNKHSRCTLCCTTNQSQTKNGLFTIKHSYTTSIVDVGSSDKYSAVCRYHYLNRS